MRWPRERSPPRRRLQKKAPSLQLRKLLLRNPRLKKPRPQKSQLKKPRKTSRAESWDGGEFGGISGPKARVSSARSETAQGFHEVRYASLDRRDWQEEETRADE